LTVTGAEDRVSSPPQPPGPGAPGPDDYALVDPGLWPALKRRWWLPVLLAILLGAAGAYLGQRRTPSYTATTKITVGTVNYRTQSVPGFVEAAQTLASSYALTVRSAQVLVPLARIEHSTEAAMAQAVTATAVPNSTVFSISATQPTAAGAVHLVNDAARQAKKTIGALNTTAHDEANALRQYHRYTLQAATAQQNLANLKHDKAIGDNVTDAQLAAAQTAIDQAQAQASAYSVQYQSIVAGNQPQSEARLLTIIQPAVGATSDKRKFLERYIAFGIAGGLVIGILLALVIPRRRRDRVPAPTAP
jgi:capsular polysaccharide biosynthesis protein